MLGSCVDRNASKSNSSGFLTESGSSEKLQTITVMIRHNALLLFDGDLCRCVVDRFRAGERLQRTLPARSRGDGERNRSCTERRRPTDEADGAVQLGPAQNRRRPPPAPSRRRPSLPLLNRAAAGPGRPSHLQSEIRRARACAAQSTVRPRRRTKPVSFRKGRKF
jgi:hypothetical protein